MILFRTTARNREQLHIETNGTVIHQEASVKFLGVEIDEFLNWKKELLEIAKSVSSACYAIRSLREETKVSQLKLVYYALIESRIRYSIKFWGNSYNYNVNTAFVAQKDAIRAIARKPRGEPCKNYFLQYKILTIPCLYIMVVLTDLVKNICYVETTEERLLRLGLSAYKEKRLTNDNGD